MKSLHYRPFEDDAPNSEPLFFRPPTGGTASNGKPILNWDQAAAQITRDGVSWAPALGQPVTITYAFRSSVTAAETSQWPAGVSGFSEFNATQITVAEQMLHLWSEVANVNFVRVGAGTSGAGAYSNNAQILFGNFTAGPAAFSAFTYLPPLMGAAAADIDGNLWVNVSRNYDADPATFALGGHILAHEIGHALGLDHPGDYNSGANGGATYANDASIWQDTAMFSNMSYFDASFTGGDYGASYALAPQMFDIAAVQRLYGVNLTTRVGDTTYGFNANAGDAVFSIAAASQTAIFCIWDAGGNDTLDLSGYSTNAEIDLRPESFSSDGPDGLGGGARYNISIARGVIIENAIGGSGNDTITGNDVANTLTGNAGADVLNGGLGVDTATYASASTSDSWHRNADGSWTVSAGAEGTDTLSGVEFAQFSDRDVFLARAAETFSGDGSSDIFLRNSTSGALALWFVNGASITGAAPGSIDASFSSLGYGDLNGDGRDDILWRDTSGSVSLWEMNAAAHTAVSLGNVGTVWSAAGIGDLNGDGRDDILWRNGAGDMSIWFMNADASHASASLGNVSPDWTIEAFGDFNGDGKQDLLWRNTVSGDMSLWFMNGATVTGGQFAHVGQPWQVAGTGDFNGDGRDDVAWINPTTGAVSLWMMNGQTLIAQPGYNVGTTWHVAAIGDYNADGKDDILWWNDSGQLVEWLMNGGAITQSLAPASLDHAWIINPGG